MATYWENSCSFGLRNVLWYKYLIVTLVFPHIGFWSGNLSLIAPFPDLCLLVPFYKEDNYTLLHTKHESSGPCGFGEEDFLCFSHDDPGAWPVWTPGARLAGFIKRTTIHC